MLKLTSKANIEYIRIHYLYSFWSTLCSIKMWCSEFLPGLLWEFVWWLTNVFPSALLSSTLPIQLSFFVSDEALTLIICQQNKKENKTKPKRPNNRFFYFFFLDETSFLDDTSDAISTKSLQRKWVSSLKHYIMLSWKTKCFLEF